jgi:hypothetical protein
MADSSSTDGIGLVPDFWYRYKQLHKLTSLGQLERRKIRGITSRDLANLRVARARPTTLRASGSPMVVSTLIRPGRSLGRKGHGLVTWTCCRCYEREGSGVWEEEKRVGESPPITDTSAARDHTTREWKKDVM